MGRRRSELPVVIGLETELPAEVVDNRPSVTFTALAAPGNPGFTRWPRPSDRS
jgi:hypothetical protein